MPCPHHDGDGRSERDGGGAGGGRSGLNRRNFVKSALLIGGTGAIASLGGCTGSQATDDEGTPRRIDAATRLNRQHAWDAFENTVGTGNTVQPATSVILLLNYQGDGTPTPDHRDRVDTALRGLERQFEWGPEGLLFTIAYSATYFDRFDADPPPGAAPTAPERVVEHTSELTPYDPDADTHDAALLLSSEHAANTLAAEEALWGNGDVDLEATLEGVFEKPTTWPDRRVGFAGPAFQERESEYEEKFLADDDEIPDETPLSMGFVAGFDASIPGEEVVTLKQGQRFPNPDVDADAVPTDRPYVGDVGERDPGVFAQGTLKHLSYLTLDLEEWYGEDRDRRRHQMYSPYHDAEETTANEEKPGSGLTKGDHGTEPGTEDLAARRVDGEADGDVTVYARTVPETATDGTDATGGDPTTAHSQKAARARYDVDGDGELEQPTLRRDWDGIRPPENGYEERAGYHFNVPMRFNESIFTLLDANYNVGFRSLDGRIDHEETGGEASIREDGSAGDRNGLVPFMDATRRSNWLVPPITLRALPHPKADTVTIESVERDGDEFEVVIAGLDGAASEVLDADTVRFGAVEAVNQARGAPLADASTDGDADVLRFPVDGAAVTVETDRLKLFGKRGDTGKPVAGTTEIAAPLAPE